MGRKNFSYDKVLCKHFGKRIAFLRRDNDLTQDELAYKTGISTSYLSSIERGITDITISTVKRLAKALGVEITDLFHF